MKTGEKTQEAAQIADTIKVLIADDDPPTRILLRAAISQWGYEVVEASNGEEAWQILQQASPPRLLILDWLMPKLDGISLCERIKREQVLHPYTILLTQVTGTTNIIKGLEAGADEFLSKPFNMAELRSRLSVGARIIRFENALAEQNKQVQNYASQMDALSQAHAKQLVYHSDLLSLLGSLIEKIAQEIFETLSHPEPGSAAEKKKTEELRQQFSSALAMIRRLQVNTSYSPKSEVCSINDLMQAALNTAQCATRRIQIETEFGNSLPPLSADSEQLQDVFLGLILSAVESMKGQEQPRLRIQTQVTPKNILQILIEDSGAPLTDPELKIMQQPRLISQDLEQVRSRLSTVMSKEVIQRYGGSLSIDNLPGTGIRLSIHLPLHIKSSVRGG